MLLQGARRSAILAIVVAGSLLVGCSGGEPDDPPTTTTAPTPPDTASGSPSAEPPTEPTQTQQPAEPTAPPADELQPPEKPAAMANGDEAGALAAADYLLELYTYTYWSGDDEPLWEFCDATSQFCQDTFGDLASQKGRNLRYVGGALRWEEPPTISRIDTADLLAFDVRGLLHEEPNSYIDALGNTVEDYPSDLIKVTVMVYFDGDEWVLFAMSRQSEA